MGFAVLFPGQGSQAVGMGDELFESRPDLLGDRADAILGWSLRDLCLEGPEDELTRTEHAQPALFALSYALWDSFAAASPIAPAAAAGHSLGEYTALAAAGVIGFDEGLSVVSERGQAMAAAADLEPSGMAALIGADEALAGEVAAERKRLGGSLEVANVNAPGQVVVAGSSDDIAWVTETAGEFGVRRAIPLKVAGAFHTPFMDPARERVAVALEDIEVSAPIFPVWSNTTALPHDISSLAATLARQVVSPVRFSESLQGMAEAGVDVFVHVGPGDVTAGMAKRTVKGADVIVVSRLDDVPAAAERLSTIA